MTYKLSQTQRSALAVALTCVFLLTGKLFVWKTDKPVNAQPVVQPVAEMTEPASTTAPPDQSETEPVTELTYTTDGTPLVPIEPHTEDPETTAETAETTVSAASAITATTVTTVLTEAVTTEAPASSASSASSVPAQETTAAAATADSSSDYFSDALFIGDSRTVGMASYAPIDGATYFATVGLSTYKIDSAVSEVPGTEGKTFSQVLSAKKYGKVYIMLGINELGNDFNATMQHYRAIIDRVKKEQPTAIIILEANLHVAYSRSATDAVVNNSVINNFNDALKAMADNQKIFYLDVNPVFDDDNGCLAADYTSDGTHPYAKHYLTWADWLRNNTF